MPLPSLNERFKNSIANDCKIFDNVEVMELHHITGPSVVDFTNKTADRPYSIQKIPNCLQRQPSLRNGASVPQLHERSVAIQKDAFIKFDTVIEVPKKFIDEEGNEQITEVRLDDFIVRVQRGDEKYQIKMLDNSTLETRWRLGCTRFY